MGSSSSRLKKGASDAEFASVAPEEAKQIERTRHDLAELAAHAEEVAARKAELEQEMAKSIAAAEREMLASLEEMAQLRASTTREWQDYEATTAVGLPSRKEIAAAAEIQRIARGRQGRERARQAKKDAVAAEFRAAQVLQRMIRGMRDRRRLRPVREAARKDRAGMAVVQAVLHRQLPRLCAQLFDARYEAEFHTPRYNLRRVLLARFHSAVGAQRAIDMFEQLASFREASGQRADHHNSVAATKAVWKQRIYEQMARAAVLRASSSRYVACKRRLGVIEVLLPWVLALPTPAEESEEEMVARHEAERILLRQVSAQLSVGCMVAAAARPWGGGGGRGRRTPQRRGGLSRGRALRSHVAPCAVATLAWSHCAAPHRTAYCTACRLAGRRCCCE
jgi:hypothetical protein